MKPKKIFKFIIVFIIIFTCIAVTCKNNTERIDITGFCLHILEYDGTFNEWGIPNSTTPNVDSNGYIKIKYNKLGLELQAKDACMPDPCCWTPVISEPKELFCKRWTNEHITNCSFSDLFIKKAFAINIDFIPNGNIEDISIFSNKQYDSNHEANEKLNDIILMSYNWISSKDARPVPFSLNDFLNETPSCKFYLYFFLSSPPCVTDTHTFKIQYRETDGTFLEMIFPPIIIEP